VNVWVHVYDSVEAMRRAARDFNGSDCASALGVTQAWADEEGRATAVVVRLARGHLGTQVVTHEMHHASTALYGAAVGNRVSRAAHLNHYNEAFAHLFSDLCHGLVSRLYALGFYGTGC